MLEPTQTSVRCVTDAKSVRQMSPEKDVSANGVREIKFPYRHMMTSWRIALWNSHGHFIFRLRMTSIEIIPKLQKYLKVLLPFSPKKHRPSLAGMLVISSIF